jgi:prepilin-type N-terminal cleavage/methylation domain-containing protein
MQNRNGFSLIELLIVVAIILVIAAIAIPNLLKARVSANEASAVRSVREIKTAEVAYFNAFPAVGYAVKLSDLGCGGACPTPPTPSQSGYLDDSLAAGNKSGYNFAATGIAVGALNLNFVAAAAPVAAGVSGNRDFCSTAEAVLLHEPALGNPPVITIAACSAFPSVL